MSRAYKDFDVYGSFRPSTLNNEFFPGMADRLPERRP